MRALAAALSILALGLAGGSAGAGSDLAPLPDPGSWRAAGTLRARFETYHPQGLVRIGEEYFLSSVEVLEAPRTQRLADGSSTRTAGRGVAHLFRFDASGALLSDVRLGDGVLYHPGGMDFDGATLWVPVSEYRPGSRAIVYRIDPRSGRAAEAFRVADHVGAVACDRDRGTITGWSWDAAAAYRWDAGGTLLSSGTLRAAHAAYQDCHYAGPGKALCSGVSSDGSGRLAYVDLDSGEPSAELRVERREHGAFGRLLTQDPFWFERRPEGLKLYFMPGGTLRVFDAY